MVNDLYEKIIEGSNPAEIIEYGSRDDLEDRTGENTGTSLALFQENLPVVERKRVNKIFDDIKRSYQFKKKDYRSFGGKMPFLFWGKWVPNNYSQFLSAGTNSRVIITQKILDTLSEALGKRVDLKGIRRDDLESVLSFASIPFENAPQTTPKEEEFDSYKILTKFDLVFSTSSEKVGEIKYNLPCNGKFTRPGYCGTYTYHKFILGRIDLLISGSAILDESQFEKIQVGLKKAKKR